MSKLDDVRALFVPGQKVRCVENTYFREFGNEEKALREWTVGTVGKNVWSPEEASWRGTFPTRASDVIAVDDHCATWKIGRGDHTVTYVRKEA